jgi:glutathione S-transferase
MVEANNQLTLYWNLVSQPSRAVKALLLMGNVAHESVSIDLLKEEQKGEEYLKINPRGLVPSIVHGDFKLAESNAILKYLCASFSSIPETAFPTDAKLRAYTDSLLEWY